MSSISPPPPFASMPFYRMTVDEYERIGGLLDDERVELIDGHLVRKLPKEPERCYSTHCVREGLERLLPSGWTCHQYGPVRIPPHNEPEPDVSVVRGSDEDYRHRHAGPADVGFAVQVSMATLDLDRCQKRAAYATAGIPIYWIVNLVERQVEVYTVPGPGAYQSRMDYKPGQAVPVVIGGQHLGEIAVDDILP